MHVTQVDSTTFKAKCFRLPIKLCGYDCSGSSMFAYKDESGTWIKEYLNPNAKEIYIQAQKEKDVVKKYKLLCMMGPCVYKNISLKARFTEWYNKWVVKRFLKEK